MCWWICCGVIKVVHMPKADSAMLTINEVNVGRNSSHHFRLELLTAAGDRASPPVDANGVDWGLPSFGDTHIAKNLQPLLVAGRAPHEQPVPCWPQSPTLVGPSHESHRRAFRPGDG